MPVPAEGRECSSSDSFSVACRTIISITPRARRQLGQVLRYSNSFEKSSVQRLVSRLISLFISSGRRNWFKSGTPWRDRYSLVLYNETFESSNASSATTSPRSPNLFTKCSRRRRFETSIGHRFHGGNTGSNPVGDASLEPTTSSHLLENS
jgi:hypothetical protein